MTNKKKAGKGPTGKGGSAETLILVDLLKKMRAEILETWLENQLASITLRPDLMTEAELQETYDKLKESAEKEKELAAAAAAADRKRANELASSHPETHYLSFLKGCFLYQIQRFMGDSIGRQQRSGGRVLQMQFSTNTSPSKSPSIMASSDSFTTVAGPTPTD